MKTMPSKLCCKSFTRNSLQQNDNRSSAKITPQWPVEVAKMAPFSNLQMWPLWHLNCRRDADMAVRVRPVRWLPIGAIAADSWAKNTTPRNCKSPTSKRWIREVGEYQTALSLRFAGLWRERRNGKLLNLQEGLSSANEQGSIGNRRGSED